VSRQSRQQKIEQLRAQQARRRKQRRWLAGAGALVAAGAVAAGITLTAGSGQAPSNTPGLQLASLATLGTLRPAPAPGPDGPEGVPVPVGTPLASTATIAGGQPVDGISCDTNEQTIFHIHAHLTIFVNGQPRQVPAGIGIPAAVASPTRAGPFISSGTCFYWLHTHAADGIIHIESPVHRGYTLGEFFDEWGQPLGPDQVGPAKGSVTAIYNGQVYRGNPRDIPLTAHAQIQLEVGRPLITPVSIRWPSGL
jgi:hypothetical protein